MAVLDALLSFSVKDGLYFNPFLAEPIYYVIPVRNMVPNVISDEKKNIVQGISLVIF
jgi:hypothetical protein